MATQQSTPDDVELETVSADDLMVEVVPTGARRAERIPGRWSCVLRGIFGEAGQKEATVGNASHGGVFIETAAVLEVGDAVIITFGAEVTQVTAHGRVRWVSPFGSVGDPTPGMGIEFIGMDPHRRALIDRLIRRE
jgi:hypothetical protein